MAFAFGSSGVIALIEAPSDAAMTAGALLIGASGATSGASTTKILTMDEAAEAIRRAARGSYSPPMGWGGDQTSIASTGGVTPRRFSTASRQVMNPMAAMIIRPPTITQRSSGS